MALPPCPSKPCLLGEGFRSLYSWSLDGTSTGGPKSPGPHLHPPNKYPQKKKHEYVSENRLIDEPGGMVCPWVFCPSLESLETLNFKSSGRPRRSRSRIALILLAGGAAGAAASCFGDIWKQIDGINPLPWKKDVKSGWDGLRHFGMS